MARKQDVEPGVPAGFDRPSQAPRDPQERKRWAQANREWWEQHPMRYDFTTPLQAPEFTPEFYAEIDSRFLSSAWTFMPWRAAPFDELIDYASLPKMDVLEIGVGNGTHAQLLATRARSYVGIDLTSYATRSTSVRLRHASAPAASILQMDAEEMSFRDESFDFLWSWGVIHHSANTAQILAEMARVLRPGGRAVTMVYHRSIWTYHIRAGLLQGLARGDLFRTRSLHATVQRNTDGAIARYYTSHEWRELASAHFVVEDTRIYGDKVELFPLPAGRAKRWLMSLVPDRFTRVFTNHLGWGGFLVSVLRKPAGARDRVAESPERQRAGQHR